jgi:hypothetical protein
MLATLLPGLRDVRVPLATGFLWLTFAWLSLARAIPDVTQSTGLLYEINRAFTALGSAALIAALSFTAYIVGVMTTFRARSLFRVSQALAPTLLALYPKAVLDRLIPGGRENMSEVLKRSGVALSPSSSEALEQTTRDVLKVLSHAGVSTERIFAVSPALATSWDLHRRRQKIENTDDGFWAWIDQPYSLQLVCRDVVSDFEHSARALRRVNTDDFDDFDRLQAEAEFRMSIALPLSAILIVCITYLPFKTLGPVGEVAAPFTLALLVVLIFFGFLARSMQKFGEANGVLVDAIVSGEIPSPTLEGLISLKAEVTIAAHARRWLMKFANTGRKTQVPDPPTPETPI